MIDSDRERIDRLLVVDVVCVFFFLVWQAILKLQFQVY